MQDWNKDIFFHKPDAAVGYTWVISADAIGEYEVSHYTLYDVILKYNLGMVIFAVYRVSLQLNLKNLADKNPVAETSSAVIVAGEW